MFRDSNKQCVKQEHRLFSSLCWSDCVTVTQGQIIHVHLFGIVRDYIVGKVMYSCIEFINVIAL